MNSLKFIGKLLKNLTNVNDKVHVWNSLFLEVVNNYAPIEQHRVKKSRPPDWLNTEILDTKERSNFKINGNIEEYKHINSCKIKHLQ